MVAKDDIPHLLAPTHPIVLIWVGRFQFLSWMHTHTPFGDLWSVRVMTASTPSNDPSTAGPYKNSRV